MAHGRAELPAAPAFRWGDLRKRAVSAAVLAPACLACIWLGEVAWIAMLAAGVAGLVAEWVRLCDARLRAPPGLAVPVVVFASCAVAVADRPIWALAVLVAGSLAMACATPWPPRLAWGSLYLGLPGIAMIWLRGDDAAGRANVVFLVLVVWASDIGAYLAGRLIGGAKLAPAISPGKTWSGAAGGLAAAALVGMLAVPLHDGPGAPARATAQALVLALGLGVAAQAGDLLESLIKRRFGVKDSGRLIPGHGGLLDRVDGLLAAAPAAALVALVAGRGMVLWR